MMRVMENAALLAVGFLGGSWFERYTIDRSVAGKYLVAAVAIISARWLIVSYRNRAGQAQQRA
jgi:hypothetical protein